MILVRVLLILCLPLCVQAIKESATELLFGGHETTASTATSLIMFLGLNPEVVDRMRYELIEKVIFLSKCASLTLYSYDTNSTQPATSFV